MGTEKVKLLLTKHYMHGGVASALVAGKWSVSHTSPTHWIGGWVGPEPVWTLWTTFLTLLELEPSRPACSHRSRV
jgi:hypothetical protein